MTQVDWLEATSRARVRRDVGMTRVQGRADRTHSDWTQRAAQCIGEYARKVSGTFLAEQARTAIEAGGFPPPPNPKAWGPAMSRARSCGLVRACGYGPASSSNGSPKVLWVAT